MNKTIAILGVMTILGISAGVANAQTVPPEEQKPLYLGGYSTPCFYVRQTFEDTPGFVCKDTDYSMFRFAFDESYRQSILGPWRQHIFVDLPARYAHK